jgi:hypothetical protein
MATAVTNRRILAMRIEGIGNASAATATNKLYRWVTDRSLLDDAATADPDTLYLNGLHLFPSEIGFSADFRAGNVGAGKQTFELRGHTALWNEVFRYKHASVGKLDADITKAAASITLDTAGLTGTIYLEREAILLGTESPSMTFATDGVGDGARGVLGTTATAHGADEDDDRECFSTLHILAGRFVEFLAIDMGTSAAYGSETVLWAGVVRKVSAPSPEKVRIEADSALSLVRGAKIMREQWRGSVAHVLVHRGRDRVREVRIEPDFTKPVGAKRPDAGYTDARRHIVATKEGAVIIDHVILDAALTEARGVSNEDDVDFGRAPRPEWSGGADAWEILSSATGSPSNSSSPAENTLPLASNPAVLLLQLLLSTDNGGSAGDNHGTYDTGIANLAGGIPAALVDVDQILNWGSLNFGGTTKGTGHLDSFHLGSDGKPEKLYEVIQQRILRPFGALLVQGQGGKLAVASFADAVAWGDSSTITEAQIIGPPSQDRRIEDAVDRLEMTYAKWPGREPDRLNVEDAIKRRRQLPGWSSSLQFNLGGMTDLTLARRIAEQIVIRFHDPIPLIQLETLRTADFWPGNVVQVSHQYLFGASATRSLTNGVMLVVERSESLTEGGHTIRYGLLYVGALIGDTSYIAPSAVVASYSDPNITLTANVYTIATAGRGPFRLDVPNDTGSGPWEFADEIQICDEYGTVIAGSESVSIVSVSDDTIEIDTGDISTDPVAGNIVRVASYANSVARQRGLWVYVADANNLLNGADASKKYVTAVPTPES